MHTEDSRTLLVMNNDGAFQLDGELNKLHSTGNVNSTEFRERKKFIVNFYLF